MRARGRASQSEVVAGHNYLLIGTAMPHRPPNIRHYAALAATVRHGSLSRAEFVEHHRTMSVEHGGMHMDHGKNAIKHDGKEHHAMDHAGHAPSAASTTYQKLDSNKDGKLSKAEMAKHPMAAHFAMLDADKNGYLSSKEAAAHGL